MRCRMVRWPREQTRTRHRRPLPSRVLPAAGPRGLAPAAALVRAQADLQLEAFPARGARERPPRGLPESSSVDLCESL